MNRILTHVLTAAACLMLAACGTDASRVRLEGKLRGIADAEFYIFSEDGAFDGIDTIRIEDGEFTYERRLDAPAILTLLYPNYTQTAVIAEPGKVITLKGEAAKIGEAQISGTEENELLSDFRIKHLADLEKNQVMAAEQFVRNHPQTLAAVAVFRKYFAQRENPEAQTALALLDILKKAQPKERAVKYLDNFYRPIFENSVGSRLPDFEAEDLDGRKVTAAQYKGRNLVIVCAGTWQSDTRPYLRELRKRLRQTGGKWECLIVSMDVDREMLRKDLKNDSITYPVLCDRKAFESPLVKKLGLHYVPSLMVVNAQGQIVQRDVTRVSDARL